METFTSKHFDLYRKYIPFYKPTDYYPEEINTEDIYFLIWYFLSLIYPAQKVFNPINKDIFLLGDQIHEIFEEEYEYAPENERLQDFLTISKEENNYYKIRQKIEWVAQDSWLFHFNRIDCNKEIENSIRSLKDPEMLSMSHKLAYDINDTFVINHYLPLLAMKGKEWLAEMAGKGHPLYYDIRNIHPRKTGFFLFRNHDDDYIYIQHLATGKVIGVTRESMDPDPNMKEGETILLIGLSKWKNEWWFSGTYGTYPYKKEFEDEEKKSVTSRSFFDEEVEKKREFVGAQHEHFLRFNKGNSIAFLSGKKALEEFIGNWNSWYTDTLHLSEKDILEANERAAKAGLSGIQEKIELDVPDRPIFVWFNPRAGLEIIFGFNEIIPDPANPWYDENADITQTLALLILPDCSADAMKFLVKQYKLPGFRFPGDKTSRNILHDLDFLLRFYKKEDYFPVPRISFVGE